jgi:Flp pilus assembly protein TadD
MRLFAFLLGCSLIAAPASAQQAEINYPAGSLGFDAIMKSDFAAAERQIRNSGLPEYDAGRSLNLGFVLAKTGRTEQAARLFMRVLEEEEVELILADNSSMSSHDAARRALAALRRSR